MKTWKFALVTTLITLAIGGIYLLVVFKHRQNPGVQTQNNPEQNLTPDDVAIVREMFMTSFDDAVKLEGTSVWMKNGYSMPYYPYEGGRVVFAKKIGVIPSAQKLDIKKIIKVMPPVNADDGIDHGGRQVFAVFSLPGSTNLLASPIGVIQGSQEAYFCDMLFYYDDPHTIYSNWPKDVWSAIDAHQVKPGMSELETRMAIGQKMQFDGGTEGNRTVTYDQAGKKWTVTFVHNHATTIKSE
ncbi:MAG TPA: hypothetical protein VL986_03750 [Terracidiphilus sp.]|nr:hypothetical protein [Terracidiphilus sp.]